MKLWWKRGLAGEQRGAFIVFTALAIWFLMMFVAFAVDFGNYYQHRSRLQNAADAAALAGVAKYADSEPMLEKGRGRLVVLPANITEGQEGQAASFSSGSYTFTQIGGVPSDVHTQAEAYVNNNYIRNNSNRSGVGMTDSMWNASQESTTTSSSQETSDGYIETTTTITPKQYCYRVDLEDTVTTFFARIFGVETLPVRVSAMAMLDGKQITTLEEQFVNISEQISKVAANYIWETITRQVGEITDEKTGKKEYTLSKDTNSGGRPPALGESDNRYFVVTGGGACSLSDQIKQPKIDEKTGKIIIGYQEPKESKNKGICAEPILYEGDPADWDKYKNQVTTRIFTIDANIGKTDDVMFHNRQDIQVLYLNRDHINQRVGAWEKFTEINIGKIISYTGAVQSNPLYLRLESEPLCMSSDGKALMMAHGTTINVNLAEADVRSSRQVVFAYDGPDPKRDIYDAPWIPTKEVTIGNETFYPGETFVDYTKFYRPNHKHASGPSEPLLKRYQSHMNDFPEGVVQTARGTSGPIDVYINSGCVLYGAIFAPRSRVILHGSGKIQGFILAREIVIAPDCYGSYDMGNRIVEMPVLVANRPAGNNYQLFNYTRKYIKEEYMVASSTDINKLNLSFMALQ